MYAQFDDIIFQPLYSFDSVNDDEEALWPELSPMTGKPKLQPTGLGAREFNISIRLRQEFTDIATIVNKLRAILRTQKVCTLIWGNGEIEGNFALVRLSRILDEQDDLGNIYAVSTTLTLKEYDISAAIENEKKQAKAKAGALSSNSTPVVTPKVNPPTQKQTVVANYTKARKYMNILKATTVAATAAYNGGIVAKLMFMGTALGNVKAISSLLGPATANSKMFDFSIGEAQNALTALNSLLPVTPGNINDFEAAIDYLSGKMDATNAFGMVFTKQVVTGRDNQYIAPYI